MVKRKIGCTKQDRGNGKNDQGLTFPADTLLPMYGMQHAAMNELNSHIMGSQMTRRRNANRNIWNSATWT